MANGNGPAQGTPSKRGNQRLSREEAAKDPQMGAPYLLKAERTGRLRSNRANDGNGKTKETSFDAKTLGSTYQNVIASGSAARAGMISTEAHNSAMAQLAQMNHRLHTSAVTQNKLNEIREKGGWSKRFDGHQAALDKNVQGLLGEVNERRGGR